MFWLGIGVAYIVGTVATILLVIALMSYIESEKNLNKYISYLKNKYNIVGDYYTDWLRNTDKRA